MRIFTEKEIKSVIKIDQEIIRVVEEGFTSLATKHVQMPPIMRIDIPEYKGELDVKAAYIPGFNQFAVKLSSGFFLNQQLGLPSGNGMMILINSKTGIPEALLLDNGYLTHVRTAAAGAISANYLAKKEIHKAGVIGTGSQARFQMHALYLVRPFQKLFVYGRDEKRLEAFIQRRKRELPVEVIGCTTAKEVVTNADIVVTTTPSEEPIIQKDWLHPGLHITAMGSDAEHKQEIDVEVFREVDKIVCDVKNQCARLGELHHAFEQNVLNSGADIIELGHLTSMKRSGRATEEEITICDLTGTGVQDTAIALVAYEKLVNVGAGIVME